MNNGKGRGRARVDTAEDNAGIRDVRRWRAQMMKEAGGTLEGLWKLLTEGKESQGTSRNGKARGSASRGKKAAPSARRKAASRSKGRAQRS